jgi:hypothetical protein
VPFCANCGISVNDSDRFCQQCGALRKSISSVQAPPPTTPTPQYAYRLASPLCDCQPCFTQQASPDKVITILPQAKMMTLTGPSDIYTLVFTPNQVIIAKLTGEILKDVKEKSQGQSRAKGKGWMGRTGDLMRALGAAHTRYLEMPPWQILAETGGNFAIDHASIVYVNLRVVYESTNQDCPDDLYTEIEFDTTSGKLKFRLRMLTKDVIEILKNFYPGRIRS